MPEQEVSYTKFIIVLVVLISISILVGGIILYRKATNQQILPRNNGTLTVVSVDPDVSTSLQPNALQNFVLTLNQPISLSSYTTFLTKKPLSQNSAPVGVPTITTLGGNGKVVTIAMQEPVIADQEYMLLFINKQTQAPLVTRNYLSIQVLPTGVPTNNTVLRQFLPHETDTYSLEYNAPLNLYVFHLKYDPQSDNPVQVQYQNAKQRASDYIKSRGVDPNSLTIDWRTF